MFYKKVAGALKAGKLMCLISYKQYEKEPAG